MYGQLPKFARHLVLAAQADLPEVTLVGGAGLALLLGHRTSLDIDLFCRSADDLPVIISRLEAAAIENGARLASVRTAPTFRRLEVDNNEELVRLDVAVDTAPLLDSECPIVDDVRVLSLRDQRANKIVTLLGRSELRDLVDLYVLERNGWLFMDGINDASRKDAGVDLAWLAWVTRQITIDELPGLVVPIDWIELRRFRDTVCEALLDRAGAVRPE